MIEKEACLRLSAILSLRVFEADLCKQILEEKFLYKDQLCFMNSNLIVTE